MSSWSGAEAGPARGEARVEQGVAAGIAGATGLRAVGTTSGDASAAVPGSLAEASKAFCSSGEATGWTEAERRCDGAAGDAECLVCGVGIARHSPRAMRCWSARRVASGSDVISLRRSTGEDMARNFAAKLSSSHGPGSSDAPLVRSWSASLSEAVGSSSFERAFTASSFSACTGPSSCTVVCCGASAPADCLMNRHAPVLVCLQSRPRWHAGHSRPRPRRAPRP